MTRTLLTTIAIGAALVVAGCGGDDDSDDAASGTGAATTTEAERTGGSGQAGGGGKEGDGAAKPGTAITTADSQFGEVLFSGDRAIYLFDKEKTDRSECDGACAEAWPPVLTKGEPQAKGGATQGQLGTTERDDGTTQVTYNGHPLYYYVNDPPGEVGCHNVEGFGGLWLAVEPGGDAVQ